MYNPVRRLQFWFKRGLALVLFILVLVGGSATAFYALAAGISALSGFAGRTTITVANTYGQPASQSGALETTGRTQVEASATVAQNADSAVADSAAPGPIAPLAASPLTDTVDSAIDGGGFALGNRLERAFGSVLGGVLNTLFLAPSNTANGSGGNRG